MAKDFHPILNQDNLDGILISSAPHITYLTDFNSFSTTEREAFLIILKNKKYLITDGRYTNALSHLEEWEICEITSNNPLTKILEDIIKKENITTLEYEASNLTIAEYSKIKKIKAKLTNISLEHLRIHKTKEEINKIQKSCNLAKEAFTHTKNKIKLGITEKEVAWIFEKYVREQNAELSFPTIVAFDKNAATPHHATSNQKLKNNELILIDFGVNYDNYCSDTTRTFFYGTPTREYKKMYSVVKDSQIKAQKYIQLRLSKNQSIKAAKVDKVVRNYIVSQGYPTIPHSLGHGIGIEIHESPRLSPTSTDILEESMVFSIEPGIYLPNIGGVRIEDLFTINNNILQKLT